ncbi:TonB-dependent receptor [Galbibacter sp. BG1]|uniref:SusC/RagA family TonB-linked outer membrane protein n=1 Tax=Galbibacter sp. BG1 TaxID=1170699 RepID=UPI0015BB68E7|nr:TonB-dependent receptor [Galbibacter sp. BG1]QLE02200.1 TonB-dependent receptor [Galbibacter sp. BG1]
MKTSYYLKTFVLLLFFFAFNISNVWSQNATSISGKVLGEDGVPLPGATVIEKGTSNGTQTDFDGNFSLSVENPQKAVLTISYVGFATQEFPLQSQNNFTITLKEDFAKLDEVVVVAYGTQEKGNITGAIASVGSENLEGRPVADFQNALQGQVAGLNITSSSGAPGGRSSAVIRGVGSITGGSSPLYVIDGNIMNNFIGSQGPGFTQPDPLSTINPADIESVTVLKDASASAIYGSRAANGVILITTKRGKSGKAKIEFNTYTGFQTATNTLDLLNSSQYQQVWNAARDNAGESRIPALDGTNLTVDTDWQDEVLRSAPMQNYQLSATGGGENTRYYTSLSYLNQEGIVIGTGLERFSLQLNSDTRLGKFKMGNSLTVSRSKFDKESVNAGQTILTWAIVNAPNVPVYNPDSLGGFGGPTPADGEPTLNPVAAQELVTSENTVNRILGNVYAQYDILNGLTFKVNAGFDLITFHDRFAAPDFELGGLQIPGFEQGSEVSEYRGENNSILLENTLNYKRKLGKHNIDLLAGYSIQQTEYSDVRVRVLGEYVGTGLPVINGSNDINTASGLINEGRITSFFSRAMYDYDDRYLFTANFRRDGSSRFDPSKFYGNFYSFSAGWNISNEDFMKDSFISNLKLRASYGGLGNDQISGAPNFTLNQNARYVLGTGQVITSGVVPIGTIYNRDLSWETQTQANFGLDLGIFENRLNFTVDYFDKKSEDLLFPVPTPTTTGFTKINLNAGEVTNKGWEITVNYSDRIGEDFRLGAGFNFTTIKNEVTKLAQDLEAFEGSAFGQLSGAQRTRVEVGHSVRSFYGYKVEGIFQSIAEVNAAADQGDLTAPGDLRYADISGPDGTPDGVIDENDRTFIGDAVPDVSYGFNLNLGYKNFDLSAQFQGVYGNDIWSETKFYTQSYARTNNLSTAVLNAWTPQNPSTTTPRTYPQTLADNDRVSDFFIEDGSYLRLKNLQIGYTFSNEVLDKLGNLSKFRLYMAGQNVFTIADYTDVGFDPEIGSGGIDNVVYPQARTITFGLQLGF